MIRDVGEIRFAIVDYVPKVRRRLSTIRSAAAIFVIANSSLRFLGSDFKANLPPKRPPNTVTTARSNAKYGLK